MIAFGFYSWISNVGWRLLDVMPGFVRTIVFRLCFRSFGKASYVDYTCYIRYMKQISVGSHTTINRGCKFFASYHFKDAFITIGDHVAIGPDSVFFAAGHDHRSLDLPDTAGSIMVGNHVWIGGRCVIVPKESLVIGEGAVVAAGSVVTRDIPPYTVVGGSPARKIKERTVNDPRPIGGCE
jgi:acetyltransferase-like isoleucine patch superfamily enzyme